jgi:hypothetical protein
MLVVFFKQNLRGYGRIVKRIDDYTFDVYSTTFNKYFILIKKLKIKLI